MKDKIYFKAFFMFIFKYMPVYMTEATLNVNDNVDFLLNSFQIPRVDGG